MACEALSSVVGSYGLERMAFGSGPKAFASARQALSSARKVLVLCAQQFLLGAQGLGLGAQSSMLGAQGRGLGAQAFLLRAQASWASHARLGALVARRWALRPELCALQSGFAPWLATLPWWPQPAVAARAATAWRLSELCHLAGVSMWATATGASMWQAFQVAAPGCCTLRPAPRPNWAVKRTPTWAMASPSSWPMSVPFSRCAPSGAAYLGR